MKKFLENDLYFHLALGAWIGLMVSLVLFGHGTGGHHGLATTANSGESHANMGMEDMASYLEPLSGAEFDQAFLEMMIAHHEGALAMAQLIETRTTRDELRQLGRDIISAQEKEIREMKAWLVQWPKENKNMHGAEHK